MCLCHSWPIFFCGEGGHCILIFGCHCITTFGGHCITTFGSHCITTFRVHCITTFGATASTFGGHCITIFKTLCSHSLTDGLKFCMVTTDNPTEVLDPKFGCPAQGTSSRSWDFSGDTYRTIILTTTQNFW